MADMFITSLRNRVRAMNSLWTAAAADLTLEQVNHRERPGLLPIAFPFAHFMTGQDQNISRHFLGEESLWERERWAGRVGVTVERFARGTPVALSEQLRFGDLDAWRAYQAAVIARTDRALEGIDEALLAEVVVPALPPEMDNSYCGLVVGPGGAVRKLEVLECFVYQHGLRHIGEIEYARSLLGLGGLTG